MKRDKTDKTDKGVKPADDNNIIDKSEINDEIVSYLENIRPRRRLLGIDPEEFWIVISNIQKIYALQLDSFRREGLNIEE